MDPILSDFTLVIPATFNPFNISTAALISISSEKVAIPATVKSLPIFKFFPIHITPATIIAPLVVDDESVDPANVVIPLALEK